MDQETYYLLDEANSALNRITDHLRNIEWTVDSMNDRLTGNDEAPTFHDSYKIVQDEIDQADGVISRLVEDIYMAIKPMKDKEREALLKGEA